MGIFKKLTGRLHVCRFTKIIVSRYWTFNERMVIRECICGKRCVLNQDFVTQVYPHETAVMISKKEFDLYLTQTPMRDTLEYKLHKLII